MKNCVFWDVTTCGSCKNRRFGGHAKMGRLLLNWRPGNHENVCERSAEHRVLLLAFYSLATVVTKSIPFGVCRREVRDMSTGLMVHSLWQADHRVPSVFTLIYFSIYYSNLKMKEKISSETSDDFERTTRVYSRRS
jgi:hypothetical protein